jgi:hypothetical protein
VYVGEVGKRRLFEKLSLISKSLWEKKSGELTFYKFYDASGNIITWGATRELWRDGRALKEGDSVTLRATVKGHENRKGVRETIVTRAKQG